MSIAAPAGGVEILFRIRPAHGQSDDPIQTPSIPSTGQPNLWLLMEGGSDTTRVVVVGADGEVVRRVEITGVSGAGAMAPDPARRALYLSIPDRAELLRVLLPREAFAS